MTQKSEHSSSTRGATGQIDIEAWLPVQASYSSWLRAYRQKLEAVSVASTAAGYVLFPAPEVDAFQRRRDVSLIFDYSGAFMDAAEEILLLDWLTGAEPVSYRRALVYGSHSFISHDDFASSLLSTGGTTRRLERFAHMVHDLRKVSSAASMPGWDAYGGSPPDPTAYARAIDFLRVVAQSDVESPEVSVHPDGEIGFDWQTDPDWVVSASLGPDSELKYAALFGTEPTYGRALFTDTIPKVLAYLLSTFASRAGGSGSK